MSESESDPEDCHYAEEEGLIKALKESRTSGNFNDVKIELNDGESLFAMKGILAARSEYFSSLFRFNNNSNQEKEPEDTKRPTVVKVPCSKKVMNLVLDCLYGVEVRYETMDVLECLEYLEILRMMMMENAYNHLEEYVVEHSNDANFLPYNLELKVLEMSLKLKFDKIADRIITDFYFSAFIKAMEEDNKGAFNSWKTDASKETVLLLLERKAREIPDDSPRLKFYSLWVNDKGNQLTEEEAARLSATFDLRNFTTIDELLSDRVVECGFFAFKDIRKAVLEKHQKAIVKSGAKQPDRTIKLIGSINPYS